MKQIVLPFKTFFLMSREGYWQVTELYIIVYCHYFTLMFGSKPCVGTAQLFIFVIRIVLFILISTCTYGKRHSAVPIKYY